MATNRFDKPAEYNPMNTYVPIPFEDMMKVVDYRKKDAGTTQAAALEMMGTPLGDLATQVRLPKTGEILDVSQASGAAAAIAKKQEIDTKINNLIASGADLSDPTVKTQLMMLGKDLSNAMGPNGVIGSATKNAKKLAQLQAEFEKNPGLEDSPWHANGAIQELRRWQNQGGELNTGVAISKPIDRVKAADDMVQGIHSELMKLGKGVTQTGISNDKIAAAFSAALPQSEAWKDIQAEGEYNYRENIKSGMDKATAADKLKTFLESQHAGLEQYVKEKYRESNGRMAGGSSFGGGDIYGNRNPWKNQIYTSGNIKVSNVSELKDPNTVEDPSQKSYTYGKVGVTDLADAGTSFRSDPSKTPAPAASAKVLATKQITKARENLGITTNDMSDSEFIKTYNTAVNNFKQQSISEEALTAEAVEKNKPQLLNNIASANFYVPDESGFLGGRQSSAKYADAEKKLNLDPKKGSLRQQLADSPSLSFVYDGPEAGMFKFTVIDKNNIPHDVLMSGSDSLAMKFKEAHSLSNKFRNLDTTAEVVPNAPNDPKGTIHYRRIKPILEKGSNTFKYEIQDAVVPDSYKDPADKKLRDRSEWKDTGLTLDGMFKQSMEATVNDPTVGFQFNWNSQPKVADFNSSLNPMMQMLMQTVSDNQFMQGWGLEDGAQQ